MEPFELAKSKLSIQMLMTSNVMDLLKSMEETILAATDVKSCGRLKWGILSDAIQDAGYDFSRLFMLLEKRQTLPYDYQYKKWVLHVMHHNHSPEDVKHFAEDSNFKHLALPLAFKPLVLQGFECTIVCDSFVDAVTKLLKFEYYMQEDGGSAITDEQVLTASVT